MAKNKSTVYLGFEDEEVTAKHAPLLSSLTCKIGGTPDWHCDEIKVPPCPLCNSIRPLIAQIYAPLDQSKFYRTLYIFACLNPICSQNSQSWLCIRTQYLEPNVPYQSDTKNEGLTNNQGKKKNGKKATMPSTQTITWCSGVDEWGEEEEMDTETDDFNNHNEENGNIIAKNDNSPMRVFASGSGSNGSRFILAEDDDDEDESNSMENDLICGLNHLDINLPHNSAEDPNANCADEVAAAGIDGSQYGQAATATICAEIEGCETDVVLVETPKRPQRDLVAMLKHTPSPAVRGPLGRITDVTLKSFFINIDVEMQTHKNQYEYYISSDHVNELYQEYARQDDASPSPNGISGAIGGAGAAENQEIYEKAQPPHGDLIFHQFITTIQQNPGQIIRYSRDAFPLLIGPLKEPVPKCPNCNGDTIAEIQILSTLIPKLRLQQTGEAAPIEYGNVLVFTCIKSCWDTPDKMRYERILVQAEIL